MYGLYLLHGPIWSSPCKYVSQDHEHQAQRSCSSKSTPLVAWAHMELTMLLEIHKHPNALGVPLAWAHVELTMQICRQNYIEVSTAFLSIHHHKLPDLDTAWAHMELSMLLQIC